MSRRAQIVFALVLAAFPIRAAENPAGEAADISETLSLSAYELRDMSALFDKFSAEKDPAARADLSLKMTAFMTLDPAKAALWEVWLAGRSRELPSNSAALKQLPKHVALRAALAGTFVVDVEGSVEWQMRRDKPKEDPNEKEKKDTALDLKEFGDARYDFMPDGTIKITSKNIDDPPVAGKVDYADGGHFTITIEDQETAEKAYLRGLYKNGQLFIKLFIEMPELCVPFKFKRMGDAHRAELARALEPLVRATESPPRPTAPLPEGWAGTYEPAEHEGPTLKISPDGTLVEFFQRENGQTRNILTGAMLLVKDGRAEFDCEVDFFAHPSNARRARELRRTTTSMRLEGRRLYQTFKDDLGNETVVEWIKVK